MRFVDYPTTLRSSAEIINSYLKEAGQIGLSDELSATRDQMQKQEISNFRKALAVLISEKEIDHQGLQAKTKIKFVD